MNEPLIVPAVDDEVVTYLQALLTPVNVSVKVPAPRPSKFVRVLLTGGGGRRGLVLHDAQVTVEAWANTLGEASALMLLADAHMLNAHRAEPALFRDVRQFGAPIDLPDPTSGMARYTATYQVTVRASAL